MAVSLTKTPVDPPHAVRLRKAPKVGSRRVSLIKHRMLRPVSPQDQQMNDIIALLKPIYLA